LINPLKKRTVSEELREIANRFLPIHFKLIARHLIRERTLVGFGNFKSYFYRKNGLEIGGPSHIFSPYSILPIYGIAENIDNCDFSSEILWRGKIVEGLTYKFHRDKVGHQLIREATDLKGIENESYDFVISSHVLEHVANPLKALFEWKRVLKGGGALLLVCPHKECTFDHNRPVTKLSYLIQDYENKVDESDLSHLPEILKHHDLSMDPGAGTFEDFVARSKDNFKNRCLHHHVFITETVIRMIDFAGLKILFVSTYPPSHIIVIARKLMGNESSSLGLDKNG